MNAQGLLKCPLDHIVMDGGFVFQPHTDELAKAVQIWLYITKDIILEKQG